MSLTPLPAWVAKANAEQAEQAERDAKTPTKSLRQKLAEANRKIEYEQLCASELEQQLASRDAEEQGNE